jgi:hypothetical protein
LRQYLDIGWEYLMVKVKGGKITTEQAVKSFAKDFGPPGSLFNIEQNKMFVPFLPFDMF